MVQYKHIASEKLTKTLHFPQMAQLQATPHLLTRAKLKTPKLQEFQLLLAKNNLDPVFIKYVNHNISPTKIRKHILICFKNKIDAYFRNYIYRTNLNLQ